MATQRIDRGVTAVTVSDNVKRLMKARGLSYEGLSRELGKVGRPILATGLVKIVNGTRRVDVDDLMALAVALRVNPSTLLLPSTTRRDEMYDLTGASGIPAHQVWDWADGKAPLVDPDGDESDWDWQVHARPPGRRSLRYLPGRKVDDQALDRLFPGAWPEEEFRIRELPPARVDKEQHEQAQAGHDALARRRRRELSQGIEEE
jgi:transcriptional regulator with XRE-family HTH domain